MTRLMHCLMSAFVCKATLVLLILCMWKIRETLRYFLDKKKGTETRGEQSNLYSKIVIFCIGHYFKVDCSKYW